MDENKEPVLCYVSGNWAYFTTQDLKEQWGDDWNDAPYEHNAGTPYGPSWIDQGNGKHWEIVELVWSGDLETPEERTPGPNSPYSVQDINAGETPWLRSPSWSTDTIRIWAGTPISEFKRRVREAGGRIFVEEAA